VSDWKYSRRDVHLAFRCLTHIGDAPESGAFDKRARNVGRSPSGAKPNPQNLCVSDHPV